MRRDTWITEQILRDNDRAFAKEGLIACSYGGNRLPTIKYIFSGYKTDRYRFTTVEEARIFFCERFAEYAKPFNDNREIRPYLHNFPLNAKNIQLSFHFTDERGKLLNKPYIAYLWTAERPDASNGILVYQVYDEVTQKYETIHSEPFDRAQRIYKEWLQHAK